jgi:plasmid replication initiation protein
MENKYKVLDARNQHVCKANDLTNAKLILKSPPEQMMEKIVLTAQEQKILNYLISIVKPTDTELPPFEFSISDFCDICGISNKSGKSYSEIKNSIKHMADKSAWVEFPNGNESLLRWIIDVDIDKNTGSVTLQLHSKLKPYIAQLKSNYTQYELRNILAMKSKHSIRLYEFLKSKEYTHIEDGKVVTILLDHLKRILYLVDKSGRLQYNRFNVFREKVLDVATDEINRLTDIDVSFEKQLRAKTVVGIKFLVKSKRGDRRFEAYANQDYALDGEDGYFVQRGYYNDGSGNAATGSSATVFTPDELARLEHKVDQIAIPPHAAN